MKQIGTWVDFCNKNHAGTCHSVTKPWWNFAALEHLILMDVTRCCLVRGKPADEYMALSYVWGTAEKPFQTLLENFNELCQDDAFNLPSNFARIPKTIHDSMAVTLLLGCKYLWVDRFCIVQDDQQHKSKQLKSMASIYANSYLTIIAADGDGGHGIHGIHVNKNARTMPYRYFDFAPDRQAMTRNPILYHDRRYYNRGWCFQENLVSRRKLVFEDNSVSWSCKWVSWNENLCRPFKSVLNLAGGFLTNTSWPNLPLYTGIVFAYSFRQLTYSEDTLSAFEAIITTFCRSLIGGILHGLPEISFDGMLLWQPAICHKRRKDATGSVLQKFPSWSWVGWAGAVNFEFYGKAHNYLVEEGKKEGPSGIKIQPTLTWYKSSSPEEATTPIRPLFYEYRDRPFSPGEEDHLQTILPKGVRYRHPVFTPDHPISPDNKDWNSIITTRTHRLHLLIGKDIPESSGRYIYLMDMEGHPVGAVPYYVLQDKKFHAGSMCEWICLSAGEADWRVNSREVHYETPEVFSYYHRNCEKEEGTWCCVSPELCKVEEKSLLYEFYNIMLIEWEDGIAYRVAVGRVFRDFWDQTPTEEIDVRLG
jgi:hypothetical protein